jgi:hypothetical protein
MDLQGVAGGPGRCRFPQQLNQPRGSDHPVGVQQQPEKVALLRTKDQRLVVVRPHLQRAKQTEPHRPLPALGSDQHGTTRPPYEAASNDLVRD